uniref:Transmembrane protein n=1 Tax=Erythrolobus madagascarensis TaxID=708628 RepID=A0A7S0T9I0_9RHOD|mmetsp:Transcript_3200/g.6938  ORF Transcript_3200/g.6938 Transcript_3200/m.6938 type:complete len:193 (+) Transcript_3200:220-798(+)|eukprot:CAMPEP_0185847220 /NCGR_PEP_ID=MMETSP1354-20130828/2580_1 /TAXON_ID=708628 /ORGANISM="Erythrolobus madagascarensis, Strain CCMP3276" /LENGTH=192 /DNA_ID=CAMNT_0028547487 /DNA_START=127 /DNA_END=705 /DNA_ORIENTATION=-
MGKEVDSWVRKARLELQNLARSRKRRFVALSIGALVVLVVIVLASFASSRHQNALETATRHMQEVARGNFGKGFSHTLASESLQQDLRMRASKPPSEPAHDLHLDHTHPSIEDTAPSSQSALQSLEHLHERHDELLKASRDPNSRASGAASSADAGVPRLTSEEEEWAESSSTDEDEEEEQDAMGRLSPVSD